MSHNGSEPPDAHQDGNSESNGAPPHPNKKLMKKSSSMYLNVRMPYRPARPMVPGEEETDNGMGEDDYDPADKVQSLITSVRDRKHRTKQLFVEMDVLTQRGDELEWREWARQELTSTLLHVY
ncbi:anion exchange protein [Elysia marginata]|uniref:Anion exchange protein n=1 Tax=Elysia marginata TaxID=1093978 RepID=A0AAV4ICR4_9GAST|nr:anion exchange protein [Elysia marginata]